jgi:hypothetical protein
MLWGYRGLRERFLFNYLRRMALVPLVMLFLLVKKRN